MAEEREDTAQATQAATFAGLEVKTVKVSDLIEDAANANTHPQRSLDAIQDSLKRFGQVEPLIVRKGQNVVLGGNGRLRAMREMDWEECSVHEFEGTDAEAKALAITLNRSAQFSEWDTERLSEQLDELINEADFDLKDLGWTQEEFDALTESDESNASIAKVSVQAPPAMTWVLIGIPTINYIDIAGKIDEVAAVDRVFCEISQNKDRK